MGTGIAAVIPIVLGPPRSGWNRKIEHKESIGSCSRCSGGRKVRPYIIKFKFRIRLFYSNFMLTNILYYEYNYTVYYYLY